MNRNTLSARDSAILAEIELADTISPSVIARRLKVRTHTVQHSLARMRSSGVFSRGPFIDIHRLGMRWCGIFMSISGDGAQISHATRFITQQPRVGWFAELHGSFSIGLALAVSSPKQADSFLKELARECGITIYKKSIAFRLSLMDCPRQYLSRRMSRREFHYIEDGVESVSIDSTDVRILQAFTTFPDSSIRELASRVGMPHTTVDLRLRKLKANRVLLGHSIHIYPEKLGRQLHKLLVYTRAKSEQASRKMRTFAVTHPLVSHFIENIGGWDFEFNVEIESLAQLQEFENQLRRESAPLINDVVSLGISKVHSLRRFAGDVESTR